MATARQIAANRKNAELSTGPRTDGGKTRSRANALTHGLTGAGAVIDDAREAEVAARLDGWRASLRPAGDREEWLVRQAVVETVRVDACQAEQAAERARLARRAAESWDEDRRLDAEALGASLAKRPSITSARLRQSRHGADWLVRRWEGLRAALADGGAWTGEQTALAFDLLGIPPELRAGAPWGVDGPPADLVDREIALLEARRDGPLTALDEADRDAAAAGLEVPHASGPTSARLRRYEASCWRRLNWAEKRLEEGRVAGTAPASPTEPAPPHPTPRPTPTPTPTPVPVKADRMTEAEWSAYDRRIMAPFFRAFEAGQPAVLPVSAARQNEPNGDLGK